MWLQGSYLKKSKFVSGEYKIEVCSMHSQTIKHLKKKSTKELQQAVAEAFSKLRKNVLEAR